MQGDAASADPNDPCRLGGRGVRGAARARERSSVCAGRGGDEAQGAAHRARRQASGRRLGAPGGPLPARQPQGRLREPQLPRERVHREPERSREQPAAQVARVEDRSVELPGANGLRARGGEHPGRLAERAGRRRFRRAGGHGRGSRHRHRLPEQGDQVRPRPRPAAGHALRQPEGLRRRRSAPARRERPRHPRGEHDRAGDRQRQGPHRRGVWLEPDADPRPQPLRTGDRLEHRERDSLRGGARRRRHQPQPRVQARGQAVLADSGRLQSAGGRSGPRGRRRGVAPATTTNPGWPTRPGPAA